MIDYFIDEQLIRPKPKAYRPPIKAWSIPANRKTSGKVWSGHLGTSSISSGHPLQLEQSDSPNQFEVTSRPDVTMTTAKSIAGVAAESWQPTSKRAAVQEALPSAERVEAASDSVQVLPLSKDQTTEDPLVTPHTIMPTATLKTPAGPHLSITTTERVVVRDTEEPVTPLALPDHDTATVETKGPETPQSTVWPSDVTKEADGQGTAQALPDSTVKRTRKESQSDTEPAITSDLVTSLKAAATVEATTVLLTTINTATVARATTPKATTSSPTTEHITSGKPTRMASSSEPVTQRPSSITKAEPSTTGPIKTTRKPVALKRKYSISWDEEDAEEDSDSEGFRRTTTEKPNKKPGEWTCCIILEWGCLISLDSLCRLLFNFYDTGGFICVS